MQTDLDFFFNEHFILASFETYMESSKVEQGVLCINHLLTLPGAFVTIHKRILYIIIN